MKGKKGFQFFRWFQIRDWCCCTCWPCWPCLPRRGRDIPIWSGDEEELQQEGGLLSVAVITTYPQDSAT